ncbi:response regulator transcription factor [Luteolibacter ambystomatis]|uniref:Response regulator transcription factor n=1 Tax=Luteolibacter ambystomatis TaxID=2824561 RepID=A0A975IZZ6_9BACT|nr:response regulator transcription factor [Luteolibacter ambystomatis]QUE50970.1 response regulator transcription factor [Luteolibacter ambystomatis]
MNSTESDNGRPLLLVDDDRKLCGLIRDYLTPLGWKVDIRHTGPEGLEAAVQGGYQAVILDVMMPGMDGFDVLRELRKRSDVPVLMLTAMGDEADRIAGLETGADDYLPKTFSVRELLARLRAVTRRHAGPSEKKGPSEWAAGELRLCEDSHTAVLGDRPLELTALEFALLTELLRSKGRVKTREQLIEQVSERRFDIFDRSIDVHVSALRRKLGDDPREPRYIRTVRGVGYVLGDPDSRS